MSAQLAVVWTLILQSESEGPTLITCAAKLLKGDSYIFESPSRAVVAHDPRGFWWRSRSGPVLTAVPAKKAHRVTRFNNDQGGIAKGRMAAQKYLKRDTPRAATAGLTVGLISKQVIPDWATEIGPRLAVLRMFGTNGHTRTRKSRAALPRSGGGEGHTIKARYHVVGAETCICSRIKNCLSNGFTLLRCQYATNPRRVAPLPSRTSR